MNSTTTASRAQPIEDLGIDPPWNSASRLIRYLVLGFQLGLLLLIFRQFQLESKAFLRLAILAFGGFAVHYYLPMRLRLPFFVVLSLSGIAIVFGLVDGAWLVLLGLILIGICHLPISFSLRVMLLAATGAALAVLRVDWLPYPWSYAIWPILGSMFMFRLMVYMFDLRHNNAPFSPSRTLAYFFLLPNTCFPLFPVVDYKTFHRTYYDSNEYRIYQTGVDWMLRGVTHLVLYRVIYYYGMLSPSEVVNRADLFQYLASNFLIYLRVSGQFHLIVGMLHLFGFNLLETNHRYLLASSFTDLWRRINIYWKDFMMKIFYYPTYFKLRSLGVVKAMVISTLFIFLLTWLLHSYQWFWLRGTFPVVWQDILFWGILAVLVVSTSLYEVQFGRRRQLGEVSWTVRSFAYRALTTVGVFMTLCVLWSIWTAESLQSWLALWDALGQPTTMESTAMPTVLVAAIVLVTIGPGGGGPSRGTTGILAKRTAATIVLAIGLAAIGIPAVYRNFGPTTATVINTLRSDQLSRLDQAAMQRGYYEDLMRVNTFNSQLWEVYSNKPLRWLDVKGTGLKRFTGDFQQYDYLPSTQSNTQLGLLQTNRWGMRDQDYDLAPATGTYRIAMLGASNVVGWGVTEEESFQALLETRLNRDIRDSDQYRKFDVLNFGIEGYTPPQQVKVLERAAAFQPDAVFYIATGRELSRSVEYIAQIVTDGIEIPFDAVKQIVNDAGVSQTMSVIQASRALAPHGTEIAGWIYAEIAGRCKELGIKPVWVFMPQVTLGSWQVETAPAIELAEKAGFDILDLSDVFEGLDVDEIRLAEWDDHPNAKGHSLLTDRLYELMTENDIVSQ